MAHSELANVEAQLEREKQRRRELEAMQVPLLQMDNVSYEQLEQLRNSLMMFEYGAEAKLNGGKSSAAVVEASPP